MRYLIPATLLLAGCAFGDGSVVNVANTTISADNGSQISDVVSAPNLDPTTNIAPMVGPW